MRVCLAAAREYVRTVGLDGEIEGQDWPALELSASAVRRTREDTA